MRNIRRKCSIIIAYRMGQGKTYKRRDLDEMAERFGVSERTIYRALQDVNETNL